MSGLIFEFRLVRLVRCTIFFSEMQKYVKFLKKQNIQRKLTQSHLIYFF
jgi:hypothetical protein